LVIRFSERGGRFSILKNSGTINLKSGNNIVGIQIDTEGGHSKGETINAGTINNNLTSFDIGKGSIGIADAGTGATTINNNSATVALKGDSIYTYTFLKSLFFSLITIHLILP